MGETERRADKNVSRNIDGNGDKRTAKNVIEFSGVTFYYEKKGMKHTILQDASYEFEKGKMYAIVGKSGAGKTTTLSLIGALDFPQKGKLMYRRNPVTRKNQEKYRNGTVSMIYQNYNLLTYLTGYQNIELAMHITGKKQDRERVEKLLSEVGIDKRTASSNVNQISGGEQQRIAIARTLATDAEIILADEPTGNLDEETAKEIIELLYELAHKENKCVITVTHTRQLAERADETLRIIDGKLEKEQVSQ